jgi:hypothetical protein
VVCTCGELPPDTDGPALWQEAAQWWNSADTTLADRMAIYQKSFVRNNAAQFMAMLGCKGFGPLAKGSL